MRPPVPGCELTERTVREGDHLHVLRLTPYYYLPGGPLTRRELQYEPIGGMQVQITQITEELDRLGIEQTVVFPRRPGLQRELWRGSRIRLRLLRLPVAPIRTRSKGYIGLLVSWGLSLTAWCVATRLRRRHRRYSAVHVHCSELPWTFVFAAVARALLRRPLVLTIHCSAIATFHPETLLGRLLLGPACVAERFAVKRADAVVVLTDRIERRYVREGLVRPDRITVIPDGVRLEQFVPAPQPEATPPLVVYCGRFAPEKGWVDFVDAAARLVASGRSAAFAMCGDGNELPACRARLERLGLTERVALLGHLDRPEVAALLRRAVVVVVPSRHEELGGTVLEALATARPVVATDVGGLPEVVVDGVTGLLVPPADVSALAAAVARLVEDPELRRRLGERGADHVRRYAAAGVALRLTQLYRSLDAAAPAPDPALPVAAETAVAERVTG